MPVLVVGSEKNFEGLRARLFSGKVPRAAADRVADALRQANPGVDLDALRPGTVLSVPALPEVAVRGELSIDDGTRQAADAVLTNASEILNSLVDTADRLRKEAAAERRQLRKAMDGREIRAAAADTPALAADLDETLKAIDEEDARAKEQAASLKKARDMWIKALEAFGTIHR